jgi:feruloyl esterase
MAEALFGNANNPDLRKFAGAGGKMILYQGWADQSDIPSDALDYYETASKVMGGREATEKFFRLFMVPGMNHCWGGDGAFAIDYLSYMEAWVERGQAPDMMLGSHLTDYSRGVYFPLDKSKVTFTRPIYPYPKQARYTGTGDPNDAANFRPVEP